MPDEITKKAEELVTKIEGGDKSSLSEQLNSMTIEDRLALVKEMDRINAEHRASNPNLPDIEFETNKDPAQRDHLQDVRIVQKTGERAMYNPMSWVRGHDIIEKTDIYDPPGSMGGNGWGQQTYDSILSRNKQLAEAEAAAMGR